MIPLTTRQSVVRTLHSAPHSRHGLGLSVRRHAVPLVSLAPVGSSVTSLFSASANTSQIAARPFSESGLWGFVQGLFKRQAKFFKEAHNARIEAETDIMFNRKGPVDETAFRRLSASPNSDLSLYNLTLDTRSIQAHNVRLGGGSYVTGYVRCTGACTIEDDAATTLGGVKAKSLSITGRGDTTVTYSINAEQIRFQGNLTVGDSIKCFSIKGGGIVKVGSNISGSEVQLVTIGGVSTANVIFGSSMVELDALSWDPDHKKVVDATHSWVDDIKHLRLPHGSPKFKVDKVIGERVHINNVTALTVRGRHVIIGKDCDILTVEYSHSMKIHPEASVRNIAHRPTMRVQMDQDDIDDLPDGS